MLVTIIQGTEARIVDTIDSNQVIFDFFFTSCHVAAEFLLDSG